MNETLSTDKEDWGNFIISAYQERFCAPQCSHSILVLHKIVVQFISLFVKAWTTLTSGCTILKRMHSALKRMQSKNHLNWFNLLQVIELLCTHWEPHNINSFSMTSMLVFVKSFFQAMKSLASAHLSILHQAKDAVDHKIYITGCVPFPVQCLCWLINQLFVPLDSLST